MTKFEKFLMKSAIVALFSVAGMLPLIPMQDAAAGELEFGCTFEETAYSHYLDYIKTGENPIVMKEVAANVIRICGSGGDDLTAGLEFWAGIVNMANAAVLAQGRIDLEEQYIASGDVALFTPGVHKIICGSVLTGKGFAGVYIIDFDEATIVSCDEKALTRQSL